MVAYRLGRQADVSEGLQEDKPLHYEVASAAEPQSPEFTDNLSLYEVWRTSGSLPKAPAGSRRVKRLGTRAAIIPSQFRQIQHQICVRQKSKTDYL